VLFAIIVVEEAELMPLIVAQMALLVMFAVLVASTAVFNGEDRVFPSTPSKPGF